MTNKLPKTLQGFNDYFGYDAKLRDYVKSVFVSVFQKYGYEPLETPSLEFSELMLGQSGSEAEKQYYRFNDQGGRDVMLKFENMISMCRAVAQNLNNITFPYKRYQIQPVWRAEKVQKGRYREFTQMDADTIGTSSVTADAEFIQMGLEILTKLGFEKFQARMSSRKFLEGLAISFNIPKEDFYAFSMSLDKLDKIGKENVIAEMVEKRNISKEKAEEVLDLLDSNNFKNKNFEKTISFFKDSAGTNEIGEEGLQELQEIYNYLKLAGVNENNFVFDPTIARGLASYTGPVWEFKIIDGNVGSVGGAGRYDKAISKYVGQEIPATGGSFGLERITDVMKDRNMTPKDILNTQVLVTIFSDETRNESIKVANTLRSIEVRTMLYPEPSKLDKQIKYAIKKSIPYVVIIGPDEIQKNTAMLKDIENRTKKEIKVEDLSKFPF